MDSLSLLFQVTVGRPFDLSLTGTAFSLGDRVLVVQVGSDCGSDERAVMHDALEGASGRPQFLSNKEETWPGVLAASQGAFLICWCGGGGLEACDTAAAHNVAQDA